ncbi:MAG: hypothetical protein WAV10_04170 [Minisyncoccia bacterium]
MEITLEEIQKKFETLPEDLKWSIMAAKVDEKITEIGNLNGLNVEQMGQLSLETHMVMFGFTHPDKFGESVKASLKLPDDKNKKIVNEINEKILKDIRSNLMSLYGKVEEKKNDDILTGAGIEIMKDEKTEKAPEMNNNDEDMIKKIEDPDLIAKQEQNEKIMRSIAAQKLSGSFQMPNTKTEYSLNNLSKNPKTDAPVKTDNGIKVPLGATIKSTPSAAASTSPSFSIKVDPYREMPE